MKTIITRKEAKAKGLKRYFTGKPCKRGHISERLVCNKGCIECELERKRKARASKRQERVQTKIEAVSVPKKTVRIVRFKVVGNPRFSGRNKFRGDVIEDKIVNL